jgi:N-dimethylarginine dimethylaminohydrolase
VTSARPSRLLHAPARKGSPLNGHLLVSDAHHFRVEYEINPYMSTGDQPDPSAAVAEHDAVVAAHRAAGRRVEHLPSAPECPDMVFTANAALVRGGTAVLGNLPGPRQRETDHYRDWFRRRGIEVVEAPYLFSGQGDALLCGDVLLTGHGHRTDQRMHGFLAECLGHEVVGVRTVGDAFYDIDLAVAPIDGRTVAWCPDAFDGPSRDRVRDLGLDLLEVSLVEAEQFALNLVSDGTTVTMNDAVPGFAERLRARGLHVVELAVPELSKGGGGVRCTALTLDTGAGW